MLTIRPRVNTGGILRAQNCWRMIRRRIMQCVVAQGDKSGNLSVRPMAVLTGIRDSIHMYILFPFITELFPSVILRERWKMYKNCTSDRVQTFTCSFVHTAVPKNPFLLSTYRIDLGINNSGFKQIIPSNELTF